MKFNNKKKNIVVQFGTPSVDSVYSKISQSYVIS